MQSTNKTGVATFVEAAFQCGMTHVVCSPGSRNAPIVIALDLHPSIETIVIHDERSAAFYALGMAQQLGNPVGVVCTSGSAMLNYYPAVAEAYYQSVPIVVMTADRPEEWVNHGDGQTIVQNGVYENHIRYESSVPEFVTADETKSLVEDVCKAFEYADGSWKGPVHFNFPLSEPLYELAEQVKMERIEHKVESPSLPRLSDEFLNDWKSSTKKMIICGQMPPNQRLLELLAELADDASVVVLVENTSNLNHPRFIHCIDRTLSAISANELLDFQPDLLVSLGGAIISKRIKKFLRDSELVHYKVGFDFPEMDTYRALKEHIAAKPGDFIRELLSQTYDRNVSTFGNQWKQRDYSYSELAKGFIRGAEYSDLSVFDLLLDCIPDNTNLHMANSSVVRYCQLFDPVRLIQYYSNRGTSGIDGSTSTACGAALASKERGNVLITGDVSFFYDSNALWSNYLPANLRIFLINNGGGGIFRIIDGPSSSAQLEKYFEAQHNYSAKLICEAFDVDYMSANSLDAIEGQMGEFFKENGRPRLMEIFTPSDVNDKVLREFFQLA